MNLLRLAVKNIGDSPFRSWVVSFCAALLAAFAIGSTLIVQGGTESLRLVLERLGADILVLPAGTQSSVENAILAGIPTTSWMPRENIQIIAALPGVELVTPQLFLATMRGASCCSVSDMFMIAYDQNTDFTVNPWLKTNLDRELRLGEAIGGSYVFVPEGQKKILIYGYGIDLVGNLEPTGSGLDHSLFFSYETAQKIARLSPLQAERELVIDPDRISAALIKVENEILPAQLAAQIENAIPGVNAIESAHLFQTERNRTLGLLKSISVLSGIVWVMAIVLIGLVTSTAISERRLEIGVLRALGATRFTVARSLLFEGEILALAGGIAGLSVTAFAVYLFRDLIMRLTEVPLLYPAASSLFTLAAGVLALTMASVALATLVPILRITHEEPGTAIKE